MSPLFGSDDDYSGMLFRVALVVGGSCGGDGVYL